MADRSPAAVLASLAAHARGDDLARLVHTAAFAAADERRASLADGLGELAERAGLTVDDAETDYGNVLRALERGTAEASGSATRALLGGALARGVALSPPDGAEAEARVAESLLFLATSTSVDALGFLDAALAEKAAGLWIALGALVRRFDGGNAPLVGRAGAVIAAVALRESASAAAKEESQALALDVRDPIVRTILLGVADAPAKPEVDLGEASLQGESVAGPRHPAMLALLGVTGILAAMAIGRVVGRYAFRYRRPAELRITKRGVTLLTRTELLGKTLKTRETRVPLESLARASREVKYPRVLLYTGLFTLALGSYFGLSWAVDGARSGSPELLGIGLLAVVIGVALDFVLESVEPTSKGKCRVVVVPRKGPALAVGGVDPALADAALARLVR